MVRARQLLERAICYSHRESSTLYKITKGSSILLETSKAPKYRPAKFMEKFLKHTIFLFLDKHL